MLRSFVVAATAATLTLTTIGVSATGASAKSACDLVASPTGSDAATGSITAPFRTAQKLVNSLGPGETGCLRAGTYDENVTMRSPGVVLTGYPGETATIVGRFWADGNRDTISGLNLDGVNAERLPSPSITADQVTFSDDDVTNDHTAICFDVGSETWGVAHDTTITRDRIHDCGVLPRENHHHGIYVQAAYRTDIEWNLIYDNADRGIQLYPDAQDTTIAHNVINGNGEALDISGADGQASDNSNIYDNLLTNSRARYDVSSWYPSGNPIGYGNRVHNNCIGGGALGAIDSGDGGFQAYDNTLATPRYLDAARGDFSIPASSVCMSLAGDVAAVVAGSETIGHAVRGVATSAPHPRRLTAPRSKHGRVHIARLGRVISFGSDTRGSLAPAWR